MNHPPIPPKCGMFFKIGDKWVLSFGRWIGRWIIETATGRQRRIIAAVAEVEWRKRAARWEQLIDFIWNRFHAHKCTDTGRTARFRECANVCYANARDWRAWGEGKTQ